MITVEAWGDKTHEWHFATKRWTFGGAMRFIRSESDAKKWRLRTKTGFVYIRISHTKKDVR